ncbi:hypothetical protein CM3_01440 [Mycoplasmoides genitalium M6282]|nr:hypothetical protein CM3_01440 [Mycoplasmoides genitalium M6282]
MEFGKASYVVFLAGELPDGVTWFSEELGLKGVLLLLGFTISKEIPLLLSLPLRYPAPVQMSGEELGVNTHRVFSLFKCWVIIDLTPTLMLEKVGSGVEEEEEEEGEGELEKGLPLPIQKQFRLMNCRLAITIH